MNLSPNVISTSGYSGWSGTPISNGDVIGYNFIYKASNTNKSHDTTIEADPELQFSVGNNEVWCLIVLLFCTKNCNCIIQNTGGTVWYSAWPNKASIIGNDDIATPNTWCIKAIVSNSSSGIVSMAWAQNIDVALNSTVNAGSSMIAWRIA